MRKQNKTLILTCIVLLLGGVACFLASGFLGGWDVKKTFTSTPAIMSYIIIGVTIIQLIFMYIKDKIDRL